jgi:hypothetical protein
MNRLVEAPGSAVQSFMKGHGFSRAEVLWKGTALAVP